MIRQNNTTLFNTIEHMLQGLAFWLGYRIECYSGHRIPEAVIVETAIGLLNSHLDHGSYQIRCEYSYRLMGGKDNQRADIVILERSTQKPICVMEFKLSDDTNNGVWGDVKKLAQLPNDLYRIVILLSRKKDNMTSLFITGKGYAKKKIVNPNNVPVSVIRSAKSMEGTNPDYAFRAICIELT